MEAKILKILKSCENQKILVVGDIILDEYIWGTVDRISPEAPVQVLDCKSENTALGGAANVIQNLSVLGCSVYASGIVGKDEKAKAVLSQLKKLKVNTLGIVADPKKPTTNKIRVIAHNQQILRIDKEDKGPTSWESEAKLISFLKKTVRRVDGVICSDYQKGVLTKNVLKTVFSEAKKYNKKVIIDPKGDDYSKYKGASIITPNEKELIKSTPTISPDRKDHLTLRAGRLLKLLKSEAILVTRGKDGMVLFGSGGSRWSIETEAKEIYDVTGAGDTVISVFSMCVFSGCDLNLSAMVANKAAGIVVAKVGASVVTKDELLSAYHDDFISSKGKIVTVEELKKITSRLKNQKKKIVFTNGCFDLLHVGHIKYLEDAKKLGDILIIGLNDDNSVRRLKGNKRPLITETQRSNILSALNCIDFVVLFSELTPKKLISDVAPDILVKGGDYEIDEVVGRDIVEGYGGKVKLIPVVKNVSTSMIVESIVEKYKKDVD